MDLPVDTLQINEEAVKDSYYETNPSQKKEENPKIRVYRERKDIGAATKSKWVLQNLSGCEPKP